MSQELVKHQSGPLALSLSQQEVEEFQEAWNANINSGEITARDLPRIKIMSGGSPFWLVPGLNGEETVQRLEGVVVLSTHRRAYWKSKDAGNVPPDCSSNDCRKGTGDPGGDCEACPFAAFGSDGDGQACKQVKQLFMLRGDSMLPEVVSLPPTSLDAAKKFFVKLQSSRIPYYGAVIAIELEKATSKQNKPYCKAKFQHVRNLSPEEKKRALEFKALCEQFSERVQATPADVNG
jgi:hypothetical protein